MKPAMSFLCLGIVLIAIAVPAQQTSPAATIKGPVEEILAILRDPQYQDEAQKKMQQEKIWERVRGMFDFEEISKRAVAANWKTFTDPERKAFVDVFSRLLGNTYIRKIQSEFHNQTVLFLNEEVVSDGKMLVKTKIVEQGKEIPVHYAVIQQGGKWRIYDVHIEGVSLVKNYRTQFQNILMKSSPAQLIEQIKQKPGK